MARTLNPVEKAWKFILGIRGVLAKPRRDYAEKVLAQWALIGRVSTLPSGQAPLSLGTRERYLIEEKLRGILGNYSQRMNSPGGHQLRFDEYPLRDDKRKKSPPKYSFYQLTLDDVLSPDFGREQLYTLDQQGFMARVRRNGKVKTWKRDPNRVEIPLKFGMYEAFRITDPSELFVMATDFPINVDPTPAESREAVRRLTHRDNRPRRTRRRVGLIKDMRFFREHGGGVVGEAARGALSLARAEREMERRGWTVEWVPDDDADWSWLDQPGFEKEKARDHEVYGAILKDRHGEQLASLWGIFDPDSKYQRVVEAELASEALSGR